MQKTRRNYARPMKNMLGLLVSVVMLFSNLFSTAAAETQYYSAGWQLVVPATATPAVSPSASAQPTPTLALQIGEEDKITFSIADASVSGAVFSVHRITSGKQLRAARAAYAAAFGKDTAAGAELRLYQLTLVADGKKLAIPDGLTVNASGLSKDGFAPSRSLSIRFGSKTRLSDPFSVAVENGAWQTATTLSRTDTLLLVSQSAAPEETIVPEETAEPEASVPPRRISNAGSIDDSRSIRIAGSVGYAGSFANAWHIYLL